MIFRCWETAASHHSRLMRSPDCAGDQGEPIQGCRPIFTESCPPDSFLETISRIIREAAERYHGVCGYMGGDNFAQGFYFLNRSFSAY